MAVTYAKVHAEEYGIPADKFKNTDLHIHAPEGPPKDGPSAGVTPDHGAGVGTVRYPGAPQPGHDRRDYAARQCAAHRRLEGKSMAAFREGISTVLIPKDNVSDLYEVDAEVKEKVQFIPVANLVRGAETRPCAVGPHACPEAARGVPQATSPHRQRKARRRPQGTHGGDVNDVLQGRCPPTPRNAPHT